MILSEIKEMQNAYIAASGGVLEIRESDDTYNDSNRDLIEAYKEKYGSAFLGSINFYGDRRESVVSGEKSVYEEYTGQPVYNFGCDFVVPTKDEKLEALVRDWNSGKSRYNGVSVIDTIMDRIQELGGSNLLWY